MKIQIKHEIPGRIRLHTDLKRMSSREADCLEAWILSIPGVTGVKIYERTCDAVINYSGCREDIIRKTCRYTIDAAKEMTPPENTGRAINREFREKLVDEAVMRFLMRVVAPTPFHHAWVLMKALRHIRKGLGSLRTGKLRVEVLDAAAITASVLRGDYKTAGSVMFLLKTGELLEEWTHKKSVNDLARSMSLRVDKVWQILPDTEVLRPVTDIAEGDHIRVRLGGVIPLDGEVVSGEAMVNQASMTGEPVPVRKDKGSYVYAGTVLEEGEIVLEVKKASGDTRYERIVRMIEESEKLKSAMENKAFRLADVLVPWCFGATIGTWFLTKNVTRALSILMVDFSCALKLTIPLTVLACMREAGDRGITVKGGKFLEACAGAETIVFDKTGTLTKARPRVVDVVSFNGEDPDELLRTAACLEEHFPHSMANAVVEEAVRRGLRHEEMHSKVEYVVAHGIATRVGRRRVIIGSRHFVFEDEKCTIPKGKEELYHSLPDEYSHLYMAVGGKLAGVICIADPVREEAAGVIKKLRESGLSRIVMMTGDSESHAKAIASRVGMDECFYEVLPEDKAGFVARERQEGRGVIMIGDGINDSPALSEADVGVAISEGAEIAREIADVTISGDSLERIADFRELSLRMMRRIDRNYRLVIGINLTLMLLGAAGFLSPSASALFHNGSTLALSLRSMTNLMPEEPVFS